MSYYNQETILSVNDDDLKFSHLHVHSDSSHDGLGPLENLVSTAVGLGFDHMALTEHGNLSSIISYYVQARQQGIKPIFGNEIYLHFGGYNQHITLLADGEEGLNSLIELNNYGQAGELKNGAVPFEFLKKCNAGLILLTGCPNSPMQILNTPNYEFAKENLIEFMKIFGDRVFVELMFVSDNSMPVWKRSIRLAEEFNLPLVTTNDVHFALERHAKNHMIYQNIKSGGNFSYNSTYCYLATPRQMIQRVTTIDKKFLPALKAGMMNSWLLADRLRTVKFDSTPKLPVIDNAEERLRSLVKKGADGFAEATMNTYDWQMLADRVDLELDVIIGKGYATYFLIVKDLIDKARENNVMIGPGRGSAVGSFVSFLLGITEVNPIDYGLQFERFLNPQREAMPDIDTDIPSKKREVTLDYAKGKYNAHPIVTYSRSTEKSLIRDLCKWARTSIDEMNEAAEYGYGSDPYWRIASREKDFDSTYHVMLNQIRHRGKHAGGIVISGDTKVPFIRTKDGELATCWSEGSQSELSKVGIVKFDMLGLAALDILEELEDLSGIKLEVPQDLHLQNDRPEFDLIRQGKVLGVFQLTGSDGIREFAKLVNPKNILDVIATVSLWRTGPIQAGAHEAYLEARHGNPRLIHPEIDEILKETYGLIVYQEDFMRLYAWATGRDLGDADNARRVIVKYKPDKLESVRALSELEIEFKEGALNKGLEQETIDKLWGEIVVHTGYSFNKSHATAYSMITWKLLWYKFHHPELFYVALLNNDPSRTQEFIYDVISEGYEIEMPDINKSSDIYSTDGKVIYTPLSVVKFLAESGVQEIMENRPFESLEDFMAKVEKRKVTKRARMGLYLLGAFDRIEGAANYSTLDFSELDFLYEVSAMKKAKKDYLKKYGVSADLFAKLVFGSIDEKSLGKLIASLEKLSIEECNKIGMAFFTIGTKILMNCNFATIEDLIEALHGVFDIRENVNQIRFLGVTIPSPEMAKKINEAIAGGGTGGVVVDIEERSSDYNPRFWRIKFYPGRSGWIKEEPKFEVGDWIKMTISNRRTGRLNEKAVRL
jgi:DNA polymerase-3 subunit alpha